MRRRSRAGGAPTKAQRRKTGTRTVTFTDPILGSSNFNVTQHFNEFKLGFNYRFGLPQSAPYYR